MLLEIFYGKDYLVVDVTWRVASSVSQNPTISNRGSSQNTGEKAPWYGKTGALHPTYGRTGEKAPWYGKTGALSPSSKPVLCYSKSGILIAEYAGMSDAERTSGVHHSHISACCNCKRKTAGGFIWRFKDDPLSSYIL